MLSFSSSSFLFPYIINFKLHCIYTRLKLIGIVKTITNLWIKVFFCIKEGLIILGLSSFKLGCLLFLHFRWNGDSLQLVSNFRSNVQAITVPTRFSELCEESIPSFNIEIGWSPTISVWCLEVILSFSTFINRLKNQVW